MSTLNPYIPSVETPPQKTSFQLSQEANEAKKAAAVVKKVSSTKPKETKAE